MGADEDAEAASAEKEDDVLQFHEAGPIASAEDEPYDGVGLEECIEALTADDPEIRARAADALLDVPAGGASSGQRGAPWAYAVVAAGAVIPLLALVQRVRRDARDGLKPKPADVCPENTDAVVAGGDAALLVLAEVANAAASFLQEEGWEVAYDEDTERPIFVDERSGMSQAAPPALERARGDWVVGVMVEALTLIQPLDVDARTNEPRWPVRVVRHVCAACGPPIRDSRNDHERLDECLSVLDIAVEEGGGDERTRVLVRGPWRGSQGDVEGETDPNEAPGTALDSWRDATVFAALALGLASDKNAPKNGASQKKEKERVLVLGLRCGAVPAFLRRAFPGVAVDVVEESAAAVAAARECFGADFTEEPFGELTREGFRARLSRAGSRSADGKYRVWSGVDARTFLDAAARERGSDADGGDAERGFFFDGVVGDLPPSRSSHSTPASEIFRTIRASNVLDAERAVVALAGGWTRDARRSFGGACAAAAAAFGGDRTTAACEPDDVPELDAPFSFSSEEADEASRPTKRAKSDAEKQHEADKDDEIAHRRRFEHAEGRAGVVIVGVGAAASPPPWAAYSDAARRLRSAGVAAGPSPFAVDEAELVRGSGGSEDAHPSAVWHVSYRASDEDAGEPEAAAAARAAAAAAEARANAGNDAWDVFGDSGASGAGSGAPARGGAVGGDAKDFTFGTGGDVSGDAPGAAPPAPRAPPGDVGDARYWTETLGAAVCEVSDFSGFPPGSGEAFPGERYRAEVTEKGYVWGDVVVPPELTSRLAAAIARAAKRGWPPAAVFLCDDAWRAAGALWARAEAMLGCSGGDEAVLEPSLAAFALDPAADKAGRRYVGNNFGVPHRDYAVRDVRRGGGGGGPDSTNDAANVTPPEVLSAWLPLVDVTRRNGCMYVVPVAHDARDDATPPAFDRAGAVALAPAPAGSLMAWAGDTIHWGTACARALPATESPRASLAFVFRKREARCDARGAPLTKRECFGKPGGLTLPRRLEVVRHALTCFEHWYGDTREMRERLTPTEA